MSLIVPAILCGGSGTRLWPASRESLSKQFIRLTGDRSTFQEAVLRVGDPRLFDKPVIILHQDSRFIAAEQLAEIEVEADLVLEPERRDSAMAVACAAVLADRRRAGATVLVMPADHAIPAKAAFGEAVERAAALAERGLVMTLGIRPDHPSSALGYIRPGKAIADSEASEVASFVEKPSQERAETFIADGYLWNSGYFIFRSDAMGEELRSFEPEIQRAAEAAVEKATRDLDFIRLDRDAFATAPKTSIDYAVMERTKRIGVLPVDFAWSDIGTWDALWNAVPKDGHQNAITGDVVTLATTRSLIRSDRMLTTVVGIDDVVVVAEPDAVLVTSRANSHLVKDLVGALRSSGRSEADAHHRIYRPWGWYQRIDIGGRFQVKRIMVKAGGLLSLQKHHHRAEHWIVVQGTAQVTIGEDVRLLYENEGVYIPIGSTHQLHNPGRIPLEIIEVQVGSYTGEDDIVRIKDVYGRA